MIDDLQVANASIKTGARLSQVGIPIFAIFGLLVLANMALGPWQDLVGLLLLLAVILVVVAATTVIVVQARRLSRFHLTVDGVNAPNGWTLPWNAITRAAYRNGWVSLHDGAGREIQLAIMFATSQARVLAAIRARLPRGTQIENDPSPGSRPNKRLELAGAAKQGRIPFVPQLTTVYRTGVRCARGLSARSLSAIR